MAALARRISHPSKKTLDLRSVALLDAGINQVPAARRCACPRALDPERAKALWAKGAEMVDERFS
jgi:hypothetical protein